MVFGFIVFIPSSIVGVRESPTVSHSISSLSFRKTIGNLADLKNNFAEYSVIRSIVVYFKRSDYKLMVNLMLEMMEMKIKIPIRKIMALLLTTSIVLISCQNRQANEATPKSSSPANNNQGGKGYIAQVSPAFTGKDLTALPTSNWIANGGNIFNQRYSPLARINNSNVSGLKGKWVAHVGSGKEFKYSGEATPVVYDGVMFVVSGADDVLALDAKSGKTIWEYRPKINQEISTVCCGWTSRGVAIGAGKVYVGLLDASLVALDQKTGKVVWQTQVADWKEGYTITSAPLYYNGKIYTGLAGGEYQIRGRLTAFDAEKGSELWRFYTIPGPGDKGFDTWPKNNKAWERGGAPVWQTPAVDPNTGTLYFSTGNPSPDLDGSQREGDNLFANSILAIDADSGKYKWHFQEVHHDIWDLDAPCPIVLFDVTMNGKRRKALGQAGKSGWVYLLDRSNGKPLVGIDEKPVPQEPRQKTSKTQPYPKGQPFAPNTISKAEMKRDIPKYRGKYGNIFTPFWEEAVLVKPAPLGGANWAPMSYNPDTGFLYVLGNDKYFTATRSPEKYKKGTENWGSVIAPVNNSPTRGTVTAIDVKTNKIAWQVHWNDMAYSGALSTKGGLVFVGHNDGRLIAYDAKTGGMQWQFQTGAGVNAPPITYEIDGVQYVSVFSAGSSLAGTVHGDSVWTFTLDGNIGPVKKNGEQAKNPSKTTPGTTAGDTEKGLLVYKTNCLPCHGTEGADGHNGPNLQISKITDDPEKVAKQVLEGGGGMPAFKDQLTEEQIKNVVAYITKVVAPKK
jgi:quinohemoprotein ethanol dehydrogenase